MIKISVIIFVALTFSPITLALKCGECFAEGRDCKPKSWGDDCDFCSKVTGEIVDPSALRPGVRALIEDYWPNVKGMYRAHFRKHTLFDDFFR